MTNKPAYLYYPSKDGSLKSLKLPPEGYLTSQQQELLKRVGEMSPIGNGSSTNENGIVGYEIYNCDNTPVIKSKAPLELKELNKIISTIKLKKEPYFVIGDDAKIVSNTFYLYDKTTKDIISISATDGKFDEHTIPGDLQKSLKGISPEDLEKQQDDTYNHGFGQPFMYIGHNDQYLLIHNDYYYRNIKDKELPNCLKQITNPRDLSYLRGLPSKPNPSIPRVTTANSQRPQIPRPSYTM